MTDCGCYAKMEYAGASHTVVLCPLHASAAELAERVAALEAERDRLREAYQGLLAEKLADDALAASQESEK